ncbi:putative ribonuclease H-like domain-containing protein [Tanacetum coccineum]
MTILVHLTNCPSTSKKLPLVPWPTPTSYSSELVKYVVSTGKDNFIVNAGRPNMVPADRTIVCPGSIIFGPDAKDICNAIKQGLGKFRIQKIRKSMPEARILITSELENERMHKGYVTEMQKIPVSLNQLKAKPADEDINLKFLFIVLLADRTKSGLGFNNYISENELGWDDSAFSVFTTNSEEVEGRPLFNSDKSLHRVNTNDFASSDSSVKSSEPKSNDSTSCASTSSVSTSESEAEIESNVGTPIQEPIITQYANDFDGVGYPQREPIWDNATRVTQSNQFVPQAVLLRSGKVSIPVARPNQVRACRPKPVSTGKQNSPPPVHAGRRNSSSVTSGWWQNEGMDGSTAVKSLIWVVLGKPYRNKVYRVPKNNGGSHISKWGNVENFYTDAEDEGIFDSGCSRSRITGKGAISTPTLDFENVYYDFKLPDESTVLLRVPRKHNLYTINLNNLIPKGNLACLVAKAPVDKYVKWHRRMGHVNYKNMNSKFCWVFFLEHKDETYPILKDFINLVENQLNKKVKAIRCDNGTEFKNAHIIELCGSKGIKRDYSNARTPQQNGVAERKNRTLIEAARTMLADSKLPTMFWTEAVRTACYVLNRVLVTSPHNKTPYALLTGNIPSVGHFKPFGCHVTILNTSDHLGKFDGKADEGYIVGYSASNKAYRVYNVPNKRVEETMNLRYLEEKPNVQGLGHEWYFDLDYLTDTLGYKRDKANQSAGTHEDSPNPAGTQDADSDSECDEQVIIIPSYPSHSIQEAEPKDISSDEVDDSPLDSAEEIFQKELARLKGQEQRATSVAKDTEELQKRASTKTVPTGSIPVPSGDTTISPGDVSVPTGGVPVPTGSSTDSFFDDEPTTRFPSPSDLGNNEPSPGIFSSSSYDDEFGADLNNLASTVEVSPVATKRINTIHPQSLIIGDHTSAVQTRSKVNKTTTGESAFISYIHDQQRDNHTDFQHLPNHSPNINNTPFEESRSNDQERRRTPY